MEIMFQIYLGFCKHSFFKSLNLCYFYWTEYKDKFYPNPEHWNESQKTGTKAFLTEIPEKVSEGP